MITPVQSKTTNRATTDLRLLVAAAGLCFLLATSMAHAAQQPAAPTVVPDALERIPASTEVVISVRNLKQASDRLAMLNTLMNLNLPPLANTLGMLKNHLGGESIREDGSAAIMLQGMFAEDDDLPFGPSFLVPTVDSAVFIRSLKGDPGRNVSQVALPGGDIAYVRALGREYVLVGIDEAVVERFEPATDGGWADRVRQSASTVRRVVSDGDLSILVRLDLLGERSREGLRSAFEAQEDMLAMLAGSPTQAQMSRTMLRFYLGVFELVLRDGRTAVATLDVSARGLGLNMGIEFKADSPSAKIARRTARSGGGLHWISDQPFLIAAGGDFSGLNLSELVAEVRQLMPEELQGTWFVRLLEAQSAMMGTAEQGAAAVLLPQGGITQLAMGGVDSFSVIRVSDPNRAMMGFRRSLGVLAGARAEGDMEDEPERLFRTNYQPNALSIAGTPVDFFSIESLLKTPEVEDLPGPLAGMLAGAERSGPIRGAVAIKDGHLILATTQARSTLERIIGQAGNSAGGVGSRAELVRLRQIGLNQPASFEAMLSVREIGEIFSTLAPFLGLPKIEVPPQMPPILFAVALDDGAFSARIFTATAVNRFLGSVIKLAAPAERSPEPQTPADDSRPPRPPAF
ncbi:MAG: hypothetical protein JJU36_00810 [Phycisphaeraceae bacterium]|nr:hypothetical protein [Phycisphaeraceae bacterium]